MPCYLIHILHEASVAELLYHLGIALVPDKTGNNSEPR